VGQRVVSTTANPAVIYCCVSGTWTNCTPAGGGSYTLPIASTNTLGGIKVGPSHTIDGTGVLDNYLPTYTRAAAPACGATWLSREIRIHDAAQEDQTWVCQFDQIGGYKWTIYSQAPGVMTSVLGDGTIVVTAGVAMSKCGANNASVCGNTMATTSPVSFAWLDDLSRTRMSVGFAVGATKKFSKINFRGGYGSNISYQTVSSIPAYKGPDGGFIGYNASTYPLADRIDGWPFSTSVDPRFINVNPTGSNTAGVVATLANTMARFESWLDGNSSTTYLSWNGFATAGKITIDNASVLGSWVKGWSTHASMAGLQAPSDVTVGDYYWVVVPVFQYSAQCQTNPALNTCGAMSGANVISSGPLMQAFTLTAESVE
jgi:hypothetical protein